MNPPEVASSETKGLKVEGSPGVESMKTPPRCPTSLRAVSIPSGSGTFSLATFSWGEQEASIHDKKTKGKARNIMEKIMGFEVEPKSQFREKKWTLASGEAGGPGDTTVIQPTHADQILNSHPGPAGNRVF